ncbi:hypothetical protein AB0K18_05150 [Nonomuraea sp. NPDC049421]|uniref:hypothetical protein n=1 Tax=Nonomuraea sp. NPDC049421 TaxID=3155275 RepID=UPI003439D2EE
MRGAVGERHGAGPQGDTVRAADREPAVVLGVPAGVDGQGQRTRQRQRAHRPPPHPPHRQHQHDEQQQRQRDRPGQRRRGEQQARAGRRPYRQLR